MEEFQEKDSGWTLVSIINLEININKFTQILGSSFLELPAPIRRKQACINVINKDDECFKWAVLSALYPVEHGCNPNRASKYKEHASKLNFDGIEFPVKVNQISEFEAQNDISITVFGLSKKNDEYTVFPYQPTKQKRQRHIPLLLVENNYDDDDDEETPYKFNYVWIKDLSALCNSQISKDRHKKYICERRFHAYYSEEKLKAHEETCMKFDCCKVILPSIGKNFASFKNHKNKLRAPFIVYADCECILKSVQEQQDKNTKVKQEHELFAIGYYFKCSYDDNLYFYRSTHDVNPAKWFAQELLQISKYVETKLKNPIPMKRLTTEQNQEFRQAKVCHICEKPLYKKRVRDHCHLTGEFRGAAHEDCNLNYQDTRVIPVVFHNLTGYDAHFILRDICNEFEGKVDLLPLNKERYIYLSLNTSKIAKSVLDL